MKNYIKHKALALAVFIAALTSCDQEQEVADIVTPENKAVVTLEHISGPISGTINESGSAAKGTEIVYTVTMDKMVETAVTISAKQVGGTADDHDYTVIDATIPPYSKQGQITIIINVDDEPEELETLELEVGPLNLGNNWQLNLARVTNPIINLSIENYVPLEMTFAWEQVINHNGEDYNTCDSVDIDIFIADAEGFDINNPWATFNSSTFAATADCPEVMSFYGLPNGTYVIFSELWVNRLNPLGANTPMPITATFIKEGFFEESYVQDASQVFNSDTPGVDDDEYAEEVIDTYIAEVTVADGNYTIKGYDGSAIATGRKAKVQRTPRPAITLKNK